MEIHLDVMLCELTVAVYVIDISIKNSIHLSPRGGFMIVRRGITSGREKSMPATIGKSPSMFALTRYRNLVYSVSRDTRAAGDLFCRM